MKKKTAAVIISVLVLALVVTGALAVNGWRRADRLGSALALSHDHAFAELVTGMNELDTALRKSLYARSPEMISAVCTDVFGKAMTAQMSLGALPFSTQELEKTAGFISRVGDYAYSLSRAGREYTDEEAQNLRALSETASQLASNFRTLQEELSAGGITMDELDGAERRLDEAEESAVPETLSGGMRLIEEEFPEIPSLIYDGPFSEHIKDSRPKLLESEPLVSEEEARKAAAEFLGVDEDELESMGLSEGIIPCYYFSCGEMTVEVTERGGVVMNFISSYAPGEANMTAADASAIAASFLAERGYDGMSESYHMIRGGVCTINYAYEQDGVLIYPDLIKVSVALDGGMVVGFESAGYISSHTARDLAEPAVSMEQAREQAGSLSVDGWRLCVIPTAGQHEVLCYEFVCTDSAGGRCIVYVNAETGEQQKILILLEDENGSLTI